MNSLNKIEVSVIIPCYNYGEFVEETIDSCLASTFNNIEIIVINDGSTDEKTNHILKSLKKPKTRIIHQENSGLSASRNKGIALAKGKYIMTLDADDIIDPTVFEKAFPILEQKPEVGFVHFWLTYFGDFNKKEKTPTFNFYKLLFSNLITYNAIFRKSAWEEVGGFNENMKEGNEDWDFWISLAEKGWIGHLIPEYLLNYRRHGYTMYYQSKEKHEKLVKQIQRNHPHLYTEENLRKLKEKWD